MESTRNPVPDKQRSPHNAEIGPDSMAGCEPPHKLKPGRVLQIAWLPIPLLALAIIVARVAGLSESYRSETLTLVLSFTFYTLVSLGTFFLVGRSFLASGAPGLLLLECGVVLWSLAGTIGDAVSHGNANINVTIFNTGILLAGLCHLAGAIFSLGSQRALRSRRLMLGAGCALALAALWLVTHAALANWLPVFFIPGHGGTLVRYCVLISAIVMFVLSSGLLLTGQRGARAPFTSWYALAMLLLAVGLFGIMIQLSLGSVVNWLGRTGQWLGGFYLLLAAVAALRESDLPLLPSADKSHPARYQYGVAIAIVLAATAARFALSPALGMSSPFLTFYPAVILAALYGGLRAGLLTTVLSALIVDYLWLEPVGQFAIRSPIDWITVLFFLLASTMISLVIEAMHKARARLVLHQDHLEESVKNRTAELEREVVERRRAEEAVRESERTQRLLAQIGEIGTRLTESGEMIEAMGECVARELGVSRCGFSRVDLGAGQVTVFQDYHSHLSSLAGVYPMAGYADYLEDGLAGRAVAFEDTATDPRTATVYATNFAPIQVRAHLTVPLLRDNEWVANFWVSHHEPRRWTAADVKAVTSIADRVWLAIERQRVDEDLRKSEERLRLLVEGARDYALFMLDESGYVASWNTGAERIKGWTSEEILGRHFSLFYPQESIDQGEPQRELEIAATAGRYHEEGQRLRKDGSLFWADVIITALRDADGHLRGFIKLTRDITERKQAEEALRISEERFHTMANSIPQLAWIAKSDGYIFWYNQRWYDYTGTTPDQMEGWGWQRVHDPEVLPQVLEQWKVSLATGNPFDMVFPLRGADGQFRPFLTRVVPLKDASGEVIQWFGTSTDITERKQIEQEKELNVHFLGMVNERSTKTDLIRGAVSFFREQTGFEAVGIRLKEGDDYPYYETHGFPEEFVLLESSLCTRNEERCPARDSSGYPIMECMCGNVVQGRFDHSLPFFTERGSFWSNCTTDLLASTTDEDRQARTRNRCNGEGYESVALIALKVGNECLGLLQLNDRRPGRFTPERISLYERLAGYLAVAFAKIEAEEELRKSRDELELRVQERTEAVRRQADLIELSREAIIVGDLESRILFWSRGAEEAYGWTKAQAQGNITHSFLKTRFPVPFDEHIEALTTEGRWEGELIHTRKDGSELTVLSRQVLQRDEAGTPIGIMEINIDITERKRAEIALQVSEQRWATTLTSIGDAVISTDLSGNITFMNAVAEALTGWTLGDALQRPIKEIFHIINEETRLEVDGPIARVLREGMIVGLANHTLLVKKDGTEIPIDDSGAPIRDKEGNVAGVVLIFRDISERKQAEKALSLASAYNRNLIEVSIDPLVTINPHGRISDVNAATEQATGYSRDELIGTDFSDYFTDPQKARAGYLMVFKDGLVRDYPLEIRHRHGHVTTVLYNASVYRDDTGSVIGVFAAARDVSEQQKLEAQLRQAQKMEALGTMSGGIAHDFNNILAAIIGFSELLEGHVAKGSRDARHLNRIMEAGIRGRELVRQMLAFARKVEQEKKPLPVSAIVKESVKLLRATTPSTINIRVNASSGALILGDPTQIQQVLMNLCTNATYAMREKGGSLDVELSDYSVLPSNGDPHGIAPGHYVRLAVRDTGTGISSDIMDKIFDPFFTTKKVGEGTGLGLSVVHGIVKQHDGTITVESEPGRGSTFTIYFPRIAGELEADALSDDEIPTGSERILFVDDEEMLVDMGEDILAELGYEVTSRMSSREALALFRLDPSRFDLVVTDQTMPEMTGVELAGEILAIRADMPIIMCTGFSYVVDADKAKAAGIKAFAMKPLTKREIAKTIRKVLDG